MNIFEKWARKNLPGWLLKIIYPEPKDEGNQVPWDAYDAVDYLDHGWEGEGKMREDYIAAARRAGKDCLGLTLKRFPTPHFAIEVLWWESDKEKGKFRGSSHLTATAAGITRWRIDCRYVDDYAHVYDLFKAYPKESVQFIGVDLTKENKAVLKCNYNGVKQTEPEYRA